MDGAFGIFTLLIIGATVWTSWMGFTRPRFRDDFIFSPWQILGGRQYYRLVTSGFLHIGWGHLIFNMFSLYVFGSEIEIGFGRHVLLPVYFASILGGSLFSLWLHRHEEDYRALGASGGVCGVIFAAMFLLPGIGIVVWPLPFGIPAWLYAILFIVLSFVAMRSRVGNIGHDAHLGGAIVGLLVTTLLYPRIVVQSPWLYAGVVAITAGLAACAYRWPHFGVIDFGAWRARLRKHRADAALRKRIEDDIFLDETLAKITRCGMKAVSARERRRLRSISKRKSREDKEKLQQKPKTAERPRWVENVNSKE